MEQNIEGQYNPLRSFRVTLRDLSRTGAKCSTTRNLGYESSVWSVKLWRV